MSFFKVGEVYALGTCQNLKLSKDHKFIKIEKTILDERQLDTFLKEEELKLTGLNFHIDCSCLAFTFSREGVFLYFVPFLVLSIIDDNTIEIMQTNNGNTEIGILKITNEHVDAFKKIFSRTIYAKVSSLEIDK